MITNYYNGEMLNERIKNTTSDEAYEHTSSEKWLSSHGLKELKLDFSRILSSVGFRNSEDYVKILKKPVASRYNSGLFKKIPHKNGNIYNVTVPKNSLLKIERRLKDAIELYKRRLEWLTTSSRKFFGVVEENNICFIIDIPDETEELFQHYVNCMITLFKEQLIYAKKFNILRAGEDIRKWKESCENVSADSIINAIDWLLELNKSVEYSITSVLQTILEASVDTQIDALYLCTNGGLCSSTKQLIMEKVKTLQIPVHVVYLGSPCSSLDSLYLTELTTSTKGRFHTPPVNGKCESNVKDEKFDPHKIGVQPDVMLIWEELDDARTILTDMQEIITRVGDDKAAPRSTPDLEPIKNNDEPNDLYISSKDWLKKYGLKKMNLTLQSFLKSSTFDHSCGFLDIQQPTPEGRKHSKSTVIDAKYCDRFGHVRCADGSVKHVQFSESMYRDYEEKIGQAIKNYRKRLDWLQNGSRELFGTIIENKVCILVDTSSSMSSRLKIVREKLLKLFQEQLINKEEFNLIHFGSKVEVWRNTLVTCNSKNLHEAWLWVQILEASGSTNTFNAIKRAYSMGGVEALYFLTDGRPDQPSEMILSQVSPSIPIHPISFNCNDDEANQFLCTLAARTGGRYHQFSDELVSETLKSSPYASEDLSLIREEITKGLAYMKSMTELRDECHSKEMLKKESFHKGNNRYYKRAPSWTSQTTSYSGRQMNELGYLENRTSLLRANPFGDKNSDNGAKSIDDNSVTSQKNTIKKKRKKCTNMGGSEMKRWLKKNGLVAQQLTIFDALAPTIVEQKGTYVPSIGKEVLSKVYGEVFPMIRTVAGKEREFKIVNPQSVNMTGYQENLKEFLDVVETKLDSFIFGYLSDDAKEKHKGDGSSLFSFLANKSEIVSDLEDRGLTNVIKEGKLLEKEIKQGKLFLKQSEELKELVQQLKEDAKLAKKSKETTPKKASTKKHSIDLNNSTNNFPRMRYHRVLARSDIDGFYHPAIVDKYANPRYVNVVFDNGERQLVSVRYIISLGGSTACPTLNVGDYVLVKSSDPGNDKVTAGNELNLCYLPGVIQVTPLRMASASKYYTVVRYNGSKLTVLRKDMFKITRSRFVFCSRFIQEVHNQRSTVKQNESFTAVIHRDNDDAVSSRSQSRSPTNRSVNSVLLRDKNKESSRSHSRCPSNTSITSIAQNDINRNNSISYSRSPSNGSVNSIAQSDTNKNNSRSYSKSPCIADTSDVENDDKDIIDGDTKLPNGGISNGVISEDADNNKVNNDLVEEDNQITTSKLDKWKEQFETEYANKINEIKEQKYNLLELEERLKVNEDKQQQQHILLEKQRQELQLAQEQFLERQIKQQNTDQRQMQNEYKDLSERQMEIYKRQQQQQDQLIRNLLEKQEKHVEEQNALQKVIHTKDKQTITEPFPEEKQDTPVENIDYTSESNDLISNIPEEPEIKMFVAPDSEAILMAQGDSGIYLSRAPLHEDPAVVVKNLPNHMKVNQEVLARFKDEGWYYRGTISNVIDDNSFVIEDGVGDMEEVCGEDILFDEDDADNIIRIGEYVIGLHPKYQYAYAPGLVVDIEMDGALRIQFYDAQITVVPRVEAYFISPLKFESDCSYIRQCEDALIGQAVVCRDNKTGVFHLGAVRDRVNGPRNYLIEWPSHALDIQNYAFIFGSHTKRQKFQKNCHVLAIANSETYAYLPGRVIEYICDDNFKVEFCDWTKAENVNGVQSFWLSPDYYANTVKYWQERNPGFGICR